MPEESPLTQKDLLELLVSQLSEFVIVLTDTNGNFTSWHPGVQQHFGYLPHEFIGQNIEILLPLADRLRGVAQQELEVAAETGRASDTRWLVGKSGRRILVEGVTLALRDEGGKLAGFGKVSRDVTERKNSEDNLKALAGALDESTVLIRRWDGTVTHWTAGCERLYGWTAQQAVGYPVHELLKTVFPAPVEQIDKQLAASGTWKGELEQVRVDGTRVFVATYWVLLSDGGEPPNVIETHTDITARLGMQEELENANQRLKTMALELERSNEELEEFARITSHDLSAPITSTRWLVDLLSTHHAERLNEEGRNYLRQISEGLQRMSDLVAAVLTHAQVGKGAIGSAEPTSMADALAAALENLRRDIQTSGAAINSRRLPRVQVQPAALTQLLQNLVSNALKYRRRGVRPVINITAERQHSMWEIAIEDNGMGIEPEWFERIFQPMQRLHDREIAGSGIGLATCKKIVTRAGGQIWLDSKVGSGSTFFFTLPGPPGQEAE